jgi:hypothetical protein
MVRDSESSASFYDYLPTYLSYLELLPLHTGQLRHACRRA